MKIEQLSHTPWLTGLSPEARKKLLTIAKFRRFVTNQRVHSKASTADGLYGVISGEVRVSATTLSGEEIVFARISPGDWFGEIALLDGGRRTHDAIATIETEIAILPKQEIMNICDNYPDVYRALVKMLCAHSREAFNAIDDFLFFTPAQRMAKIIIAQLKITQGNCLPLKQKELGAMIGISRQSTNKILKKWESHGWIHRGYGQLKIINENKFIEMLEG